MSEDPLYDSFREAIWFQELIKSEKEKYNALLKQYPRAEEITGHPIKN